MSQFPFMDEPEERDLNEVVRRAASSNPLPKRFYERAEAILEGSEYVLKLDGRVARTPARNVLQVSNRELAELIAQEWQSQGKEINPDTMPFTRIVNSTLDGVANRPEEVIADMVRYAGSDLVLYRSDGPARLVEMQQAAWNPVLEWHQQKSGASFLLAEGVMHVEQPEVSLNIIRDEVRGFESVLALAALHVMTTLTGSVLISLAHARNHLSSEAAWEAAHIDELYQEQVWGIDTEAHTRRKSRERDFLAASRIIQSLSV
ncbi:ATP12 family protein [Microvirga sp. W0021]|uniref:ATP12 family protein n=1 Tax=Hohaiivirga grylli TaxID=3133970 RepID=A0ABV0BMF9_9HYPH